MDVAGANLAGIVNVFGDHAKRKLNLASSILKICESKKAQRLNEDSAEEFKTLCNALFRSTMVAGFEAAKQQLDTFIAADSRRVPYYLDFMVTWEKGVYFPCICSYNASGMNQGEVVHAGWTNRDWSNMLLLDVCM